MNKTRNSGDGNRTTKGFPCPAGCGKLVTESDVNYHLDRCLRTSDDVSDVVVGLEGADDANQQRPSDQYAEVIAGKSSATKRPRRATSPSPSPKLCRVDNGNAFSHMMNRAQSLFSKQDSQDHIVKHRFHLHNTEGLVTWTVEDAGDKNDDDDGRHNNKDGDENDANPKEQISKAGAYDAAAATSSSLATDEVHWSATTIISSKRMKSITIKAAHKLDEQQTTYINTNEEALELTISSHIPPGDKTQRLVRRHSRLSVSHLKSCLQKSIRRRAPLPAVRVAMELVDKAWGDLIRRLPIIVLEDSALHPDFGFLVWLMVAESRGYFPSPPLLQRVLQIVFEVASCPRQDVLADCITGTDVNKLPSNLSLKTPMAHLFPEPQANACEVLIRSMLLRAQYGGMKCDVQMLHSFAVTWLKRFNTMTVPSSLASVAPGLECWCVFPAVLNEKAREKSEEIVTSQIACPGGLSKLSLGDVCAVGIDFHCSSVVEYLLSLPGMQAHLCERLASPTENSNKDAAGRDWIAGKLKGLIWHYSSGINHRRSLFEAEKKEDEDSVSKAVWTHVLKEPFNDYTKRFVRDRIC